LNIQSFWVYILLCENNTYYTGYTNALAKRIQSHFDGTGKCKYTRSFKPIKIVQCWEVKGGKSAALKLEARIKKLSRFEKEALIAQPLTLSTEAIPCIIKCARGYLHQPRPFVD